MMNLDWHFNGTKSFFNFSWSRSDAKLFAFVFFLCCFAKGAAAFRGLSVDDYSFSFGVEDGQLELFLSQGRIFGWLIAYTIDSIGVNLNDTYFTMVLCVLALQSALVVSALRFVGYPSLIGAGIIGGLMALHPYAAESLTFKVILPVYAMALLFTIVAIELVNSHPKGLRVKIVAVLTIAAALMTYQAALNYLTVVAFGSLLMSTVLDIQTAGLKPDRSALRARGYSLLLYSFFGTVIFIAVLWLIKIFGVVGNLTPRASFIELSDFPKRFEDVLNGIYTIFFRSEPIFPAGLKFPFFALIAGSVIIIAATLLTRGRDHFNTAFGLFILSIVPILAIGIIIPFNDWWPVPRVLAHDALLFGVLFASAGRVVSESKVTLNQSIARLFAFVGIVILIGFVLVNNQIFADQQKIAQWDRFKANRIVARLEETPGFKKVTKLYVDGGRWGYPVHLQTLQGDMNISAFFPSWSKQPLVLETTGYSLALPSSAEIRAASEMCASRRIWPDKDSVFINGDIAVVCLERSIP